MVRRHKSKLQRFELNKSVKSLTHSIISIKKKTTGNLKSTMMDYAYESTVNVIRYIVQPTKNRFLERLLWLIAMTITTGVTIWLISYSYVSFWDSPTATTELPTRKSVTEIAFPALGICNGNRMIKSNLMKYANML